VRPGRLAITLGLANLFAGAISGMPVCHGAGGMTAHRSFGARSGGAPVMLGSVLIAVALGIGATLTAALAGFPVPILAGLLTVAGLLHITLLKDLRGPWHWALALAVGITGFLSNLAVALVGALLLWFIGGGLYRRFGPARDPARRQEPQDRPAPRPANPAD
jgi:MFS superfamily sulfate permease-like transporter